TFQGGDAAGHPPTGAVCGAGLSRGITTEDTPGLADDLSEVPAESAARPLCQRLRSGRGFTALFGRGTDPGSADWLMGACREMGSASSSAGGPGGGQQLGGRGSRGGGPVAQCAVARSTANGNERARPR